MATSPKKKERTSPRSSSREKSHFYFIFICILSLLIAAFIIPEQIKNTQMYLDYKEQHGNMVMTQKSNESISLNYEEEISDERIKAISILGERNSGTTWMYEHLNECFNHTIPVKRRLTRYKHWFQDENVGDPIIDGTLVISMFRNPFEWVEAMRKKPHHAPKHMFMNDWKEFVTKPWTMDRVGKDLTLTEEEKSNPKTCQEDFMFRDLISCHLKPYPKGTFSKTHYSEHQPFYEMKYDGSGEPFDNILDMRAAKIRNFLSTKDYMGVVEYWILQYEVMVASGTQSLIEEIEKLAGVESKCIPSPSQKNRKRREIKTELMEYLMENLDWEAENMVGYYKTGMKKPAQKQ